MKKITITALDADCYDFKRICVELARQYDWHENWTIREGTAEDGRFFEEVSFRMDGIQYLGEISGNEFSFCEVDEVDGTMFPDTTTIFDWMMACGVNYAIRGTDEDGRLCFIACD